MLIEEIRNIKSSRKDLRNFGLTVGVASLLLGGLLFWLEKSTYHYFLIPGAVLVISGLAVPVVLKPIQKLWMTAAVVIGWFMTRLILSVLFYFVLTPIGLLAKMMGKDFLDTKIDRSRESYWNYRDGKKLKSIDLERQF